MCDIHSGDAAHTYKGTVSFEWATCCFLCLVSFFLYLESDGLSISAIKFVIYVVCFLRILLIFQSNFIYQAKMAERQCVAIKMITMRIKIAPIYPTFDVSHVSILFL